MFTVYWRITAFTSLSEYFRSNLKRSANVARHVCLSVFFFGQRVIWPSKLIKCTCGKGATSFLNCCRAHQFWCAEADQLHHATILLYKYSESACIRSSSAFFRFFFAIHARYNIHTVRAQMHTKISPNMSVILIVLTDLYVRSTNRCACFFVDYRSRHMRPC